MTERQTYPRYSRTTEADTARDTLAAALTRAGIQLPAMDVRSVLRSADGTSYALLDLGVCSPPVALALAEVVARGARP